jgi:5'-3' exonuclease
MPRAHQNETPAASAAKTPIYLLDTMAFIFRAYHAMQRSRPMSTRTGIPTAATYVFVNMLNKLRKDFNPEYLAAVYDVGAPVHRDTLALQLKDVKKFNIKTQQFEATEYAGYKANRKETPPDLIQQQPYIRRALEAFRIPILYYEGFEADDVIGTLSCQLSALGHRVYVVSSDKDMMQLVNENVSILNPTKDNLILDPAGVEQALGVPPQRVIDVMALRGDSIDNIPGAPGIGDKGSVELIQQFGTVEAAMDAAVATPDAIKRKTYRESLANNRDNILLSKELVILQCPSRPISMQCARNLSTPRRRVLCSRSLSSPRCSKNSRRRRTPRRRPTRSMQAPTSSCSFSRRRARKTISQSRSPKPRRQSPRSPRPIPPIRTPILTSKPSPSPSRRRRCRFSESRVQGIVPRVQRTKRSLFSSMNSPRKPRSLTPRR